MSGAFIGGKCGEIMSSFFIGRQFQGLTQIWRSSLRLGKAAYSPKSSFRSLLSLSAAATRTRTSKFHPASQTRFVGLASRFGLIGRSCEAAITGTPRLGNRSANAPSSSLSCRQTYRRGARTISGENGCSRWSARTTWRRGCRLLYPLR